jgi:hypothetical protein
MLPEHVLRAYQTLELPPGAQLEEVKSAYRDLAKVWHPDRYQNEPERLRLKAESKLKEITLAYRVLLEAAEGRAEADPIPMDFGETWGYIDERGETAIYPQYEAARPFVEGLAAVRVLGKWGFVDREGHWVVNPLYEECGDFSESLAAVEWHGKWGYIDRTGSFAVVPRYQEAGPFENGRARVRLGARVGTVDRSGRLTFDPGASGRHLA